MLVLSRGQHQTIEFPALDITVEVLRAGPSRVRLGISAPHDVRVLRGELAKRDAPAGGAALDDYIRCCFDDDLVAEAPPTAERRVLLVEDNRNELELLSGYLQLKGYDVSIARDGRQALELLEQRLSPHCMLLDMQMPAFDGPWMLRTLRGHAEFREIPVIAISGTARSDWESDDGSLDVSYWYQKPISPNVLVEQIQAVCDDDVTWRR
jgi:CheY-like chemotaxis protein/sRNA-binding carbon storage regulator CsrA